MRRYVSSGSNSHKASKILSEPDGRLLSVNKAVPPSFWIALRILSLSHATKTGPKLAATARFQT